MTSEISSIRFQAPIPLYNQLKELLREKILSGIYSVDERMPSESELGQQYQVSRITVRQALSELQKEGLIFKVHGKGTYVTKPKAFQNVSTLQGLAESLAQFGYEVSNRVLSMNSVAANVHVARKLELNPGEKVVEIKRVRMINRQPTSLEISYLVPTIGERLRPDDLTTRDIFIILENDLQLNLGHAALTIDAVAADQAVVSALGVTEGAPIMRIERLTHTADGKPIDFEFLYYRGDAFQYQLRIDRQPKPRSEQGFT